MGGQREALHVQGTCQTHAVSAPKCDEMLVFIACSQADFVCLVLVFSLSLFFLLLFLLICFEMASSVAQASLKLAV